jgi:structural maintenance of chromosome 3 (chondroitin sulfate proteoglycan 6)
MIEFIGILSLKLRQLQSSVSKEVNMGLSTVKKIKQTEKLTGVYGPLIELFDVADEFVTAVEVTAGNRFANHLRLFFHYGHHFGIKQNFDERFFL